MAVVNASISLSTQGNADIREITEQVAKFDNRPRQRDLVVQIMGE